MAQSDIRWIASMYCAENLVSVNPVQGLDDVSTAEYVTHMVLRRRLLVCGTSGGQSIFLINLVMIYFSPVGLSNISFIPSIRSRLPVYVRQLRKKAE